MKSGAAPVASAPLEPRRLPGLLAALIPSLALTLAPLNSNDFWFHLATGRWIATHRSIPRTDVFSFTARGEPWVVHEWLWELAVWMLWRTLGWVGVLAARVAQSVGALGLAWATARLSGSSPTAAMLATALMALAAARRFTDRPQLFTAVAFTLLLFLIELHRLGRPRYLRWVLVPLFVVWANCHAGVIYGLLLLAYEALWTTGERSWLRARELGLGLAVALALCLLATPFGLEGLLYPLHLLQMNQSIDVLEYRPLWSFLSDASFWPAGLAIGIATLASGDEVRRNPRPALRALALIVGALIHVRGIDLAAIGAISPVAAWLERHGVVRSVQRASAGMGAVGLLVLLWLATDPNRRPGLGVTKAVPQGAVDFLDSSQVEGLGYNTYELGGYLLYAAPGRPVFIDGRVDPYYRLFPVLASGVDPFVRWPLTYAVTTHSDAELGLVRQHLALAWFDDGYEVAAQGHPEFELHCLLPEGPFFADGQDSATCLREAARMEEAEPHSWRAGLLHSAALLWANQSDAADISLRHAASQFGAPAAEVLKGMRAVALSLQAAEPERTARLQSIARSWRDPGPAVLAALAAGDCSAWDRFSLQYPSLSNWLADPHSPVLALRRRACAAR